MNRNRWLDGVSFYGLAYRGPDGAGGGGGDAGGAGASGGNGGSTERPQGDGAAAATNGQPAGVAQSGEGAGQAANSGGTTALGGDGEGGDEGNPADKPGNGKEARSALGGDDEEDGDDKPGDEKKPEETDEEKAAREAKEAEEEAKNHAPAEGKYEPFGMPDGYAVNEEMQTKFSALGVKLDLNQEKMQELVDLHIEQMRASNQEWFDNVSKWQEAAKNDPEIGGKDRKEKLATMRRARDAFGKDPELIELMELGNIGDHPALQRYFYRVGRQMRGDKTDKGAAPVEQKTLGQVLYGGK